MFISSYNQPKQENKKHELCVGVLLFPKYKLKMNYLKKV